MTRWSILPSYLVRAAGFAFDRLEALRSPRSAAAADALDTAFAERLAVGISFDRELGQERYADHPAFDDPGARKVMSRHVKLVRAFARQPTDAAVPVDSFAEVTRVVPRIASLATELAQAHARWQAASQAFATTFAGELEEARVAIRRLYADERLQEAVFLESPEAYERIRQLVATEGPRNARARQRERLGAMYAQRFCAKNDTNSICGPHGLASMTAGSGAAGVEILDDLHRETYFSHWAAQRLLDEAVHRAGADARITYRSHPSARVEDGSVAWCVMEHDATSTFRRRYARSELPVAASQLLRALSTPRTATEIATLATELDLDREELVSFVDELVGAGVVLRGPTLAPGLFHPLRAVAAELARWPESETRRWALAEIAAFERLVAEFASAPLPARLALHAQIAARFVEATGDPASRGEGSHYADRSVLHEDCCVVVRSELGAVRSALDGALPALVAALELPLELARERVREWFRARFGADTRIPVLEAHRAFDDDRVLETPAGTARADTLRSAMERVRDTIARAATRPKDGTVRLSTEDLRGALAGVDEPAHAGYVSADVLLRRVAENRTELVLGELHGFFFLPTCLLDVLPPDDRERVLNEMRGAVREMARDRVTAECVFLHTQATDRRFPIATTDLHLMVPGDRPDALDLGGLDMRLVGDQLEFWQGDREVVPLVAYTRYPFLLYTSRIAPLFDDYSERFFPDSLLPASLRGGDAPRLAVDDVVFRRRTWRRPVAAVRAALHATSEAELFRRAQAFRRELGCGAQVFVSLAGEPKPVLLDFHDVFLLAAFANLLERQAEDGTVKLGEMLPGPSELVARGADGLRTSELRMGFYRLP